MTRRLMWFYGGAFIMVSTGQPTAARAGGVSLNEGRAEWRNIVEVREVYPHADAVGTCTVFNIRGNHFRLITKIQYRIQRVYVKHVLTHAEYDRERWKNDCGS